MVVGVQLGAKAVVSFRDKAPAVISIPSPMAYSVDKQEELKKLLAYIGLVFTAKDDNETINEEAAAELAKLASAWFAVA